MTAEGQLVGPRLGQTINGGVLSWTLIVNEHDAEPHAESDTKQFTVLVPKRNEDPLTDEQTTLELMSPSSASDAETENETGSLSIRYALDANVRRGRNSRRCVFHRD